MQMTFFSGFHIQKKKIAAANLILPPPLPITPPSSYNETSHIQVKSHSLSLANLANGI